MSSSKAVKGSSSEPSLKELAQNKLTKIGDPTSLKADEAKDSSSRIEQSQEDNGISTKVSTPKPAKEQDVANHDAKIEGGKKGSKL
jgi:hypothetical protein